MKYREVAAGLVLVSALAGCTASENGSPVQGPRLHPGLRFLPNSNDSDANQVVNCAANPQDTAAIVLPSPRDGASVTITLGLSEKYTNENKPQSLTFLGGVTILATPAGDEFAASDKPGTVTTVEGPSQLPLLEDVQVGKYTLTLVVQQSPDAAMSATFVPEAYLTCNPLQDSAANA